MRTESSGTVTAASAAEAESVEFVAADGTPLAGRFYSAGVAKRSNPALICTATGVPQRFYAAFASWLAQRGGRCSHL